MRKDKKLALRLRKRGLSYHAINRKLGVPKSTLSDWFSELPWSAALRRDLTKRAFLKVYPQLRAMARAQSLRWERWRRAAREDAVHSFPKFRSDPLFIAGVMLYWAEGDRMLYSPVRVSNTDPDILRILVTFFKEKCKVPKEKIKAHLILYPDLSEKICRKYWSLRIGIPEGFFNKTQFIRGRHPKRRLSHGICAIEIASRQLKEKLLVWIKKISSII